MTAYEAYLAHQSRSGMCTCAHNRPGFVASTVRERRAGTTIEYVGEHCPEGARLWQWALDDVEFVIGPHEEKLTVFPGMTPPAWIAAEIRHCVGVHAVCGGLVNVHDVSSTHKALHCRECGLRFAFPKTLTTIAELRAWAGQAKR